MPLVVKLKEGGLASACWAWLAEMIPSVVLRLELSRRDVIIALLLLRLVELNLQGFVDASAGIDIEQAGLELAAVLSCFVFGAPHGVAVLGHGFAHGAHLASEPLLCCLHVPRCQLFILGPDVPESPREVWSGGLRLYRHLDTHLDLGLELHHLPFINPLEEGQLSQQTFDSLFHFGLSQGGLVGFTAGVTHPALGLFSTHHLLLILTLQSAQAAPCPRTDCCSALASSTAALRDRASCSYSALRREGSLCFCLSSSSSDSRARFCCSSSCTLSMKPAKRSLRSCSWPRSLVRTVRNSELIWVAWLSSSSTEEALEEEESSFRPGEEYCTLEEDRGKHGRSRRRLREVKLRRHTVNMAAVHRLVIVRHGESAWNQENRFCGWFDADLSEKGM
ncbi:hypothetical protein F7725_015350 [Dissostichus mawsoni]|uniref:Uncharacterized protein n=1 Tax=Dissostichus mawsoni TaxID=36200 RepID=A0A7J5YI61_DISMA|nr:hypothetical protein F7725_015350 [Dissostichus mawsoni]